MIKRQKEMTEEDELARIEKQRVLAKEDEILMDNLGYRAGLPLDAKVAFLEEQIHQTNIIIFRNEVDLLLFNHIEVDSEEMRDEQAKKAKDKKRELQQLVRGVKIMQRFLDEIRVDLQAQT
jgi:hypothetical protein